MYLELVEIYVKEIYMFLNIYFYQKKRCDYVRRCTKKKFKTVIDASASNYETIIFSGGKIGYQVEVRLTDLKKVIDFSLKDIKINNIQLTI